MCVCVCVKIDIKETTSNPSLIDILLNGVVIIAMKLEINTILSSYSRNTFTSDETSSLGGRFWLTAAREACSISRMHLLILSMAESHSFWPGALSL